MTAVWNEGWFRWCVVVIIALPVASVALAELQASLERRRSSMVRPVQMLRTYILPLGALVVLLAVIPDEVISNESSWFKITATVFGLLLLNFGISGLNTALFVNAEKGSWRRKLPTIFIDIARIVIIAIGLAILFSWIWGADVGGIFTALGVTSVVLGLALQNAVGSIVAGLLLLFEQPFELGDWLQAGGVTGRVVEVNWRAVHIQTASGLQIVPNSALADASFTNFSRPDSVFTETVEVVFAKEDPPAAVMDLLHEVADGLPNQLHSHPSQIAFLGAGKYATSLTFGSFAMASETRALFQLRLWYAARRKNLALDGADIWKDESLDDVKALVRQAAPRLHLDVHQVDDLAARLDLERFATGEIVERFAETRTPIRWIAEGTVTLSVPYGRGGTLNVATLSRGDLLGLTSLTHQPSPTISAAVTPLTVLTIPSDVADELARSNNRLARLIGAEIDQRRAAIDAALDLVSEAVR